jgi:hypothetical protein
MDWDVTVRLFDPGPKNGWTTIDPAPQERAWPRGARPGNTIFRESSRVSLLDWETASLGGAEADLGWWLFCERLASNIGRVPRLESIGSRLNFISAGKLFAGRRRLPWTGTKLLPHTGSLSSASAHLPSRGGGQAGTSRQR